MKSGIAAICLMMTLAGLAGCIGAKDDVHKLTAQATNTTGHIAANETTQPNGGQISAFTETNATETSGTGAMMHAHDYWHGASRKVIFTQSAWLVPLPLLPDGKPAGTAIADFDIPAGTPNDPHMVFEGTDHLEFELANVTVMPDLTCAAACSLPPGTPPHPAPSLLFDYLSASDEPGKFRTGGEIDQGKVFLLPVKPTDADMPHSEKSLWVFRIYTSQPTSISFDLKITAVKGNVIALWPPHPNLYADKTARTVFDSDVSLANEGTAQENVDGKDPAWTHPGRIISWGTDTVDVTVSNAQLSQEGGNVIPVDHYVLEYNNASFVPKLGNGDQAGARLVDTATDGKTFHFHIVLDNQSYDSPYGQASRWGFRLMPRFEDPTNCGETANTVDPSGNTYHNIQNTLIGCQYLPWTLTYHLTIVAHGHSTANGVDAGAASAVSQQPTPPR